MIGPFYQVTNAVIFGRHKREFANNNFDGYKRDYTSNQ